MTVAISLVFVFGCSTATKTELQNRFQTEYTAPGLPASGQFRTVAVADLDNDGNPDIAAGGSYPGTVGIWYGDGAGGVTPPTFLPLEADVRFLTVGDFDEDGFKDLAFSVQREATGIQVWKNLGGRDWRRNGGPSDINNYQGVQTADVNGDGHLDLIAANSTLESEGGIQVWIGDGRGEWLRETGPTVNGLYMDVEVGDFNGDGNPDIVGAGWGRNAALNVWLGDGRGGWVSLSHVAKGSFYGLNIADLNGDGHLDLLTGTYRSGIQLFAGDGQGNFAPMFGPIADRAEEVLISRKDDWLPERRVAIKSPETKKKEINRSFWDAFPIDLDGDGDMDIVAGSTANKGLRAWENKGNDTWELVLDRFPDEGSYYEIIAADLDRDGFPELIASSFGEGVRTWQGKKESRLAESADSATRSAGQKKEDRIVAVLENESFTTIDGIFEYRIGPLDVLEVSIWKGIDATKSLVTVGQTGKISFGFVEDLYVEGLTTSQLDERLSEILMKFFKNPKVDVLVKEFNSKYVSLMGAVGDGSGGTVRVKLKGRTTVLDALGEQGGMARDAQMSEVRIRKKDGQAFTVDLAKAIFQGDPNQNVVLDAGDVVYVPWLTEEANRVYVLGEVRSPGIYTFKGSNMKIFDAVMKAGGVTIFAREESTKIVRGDVTQPEVLSADIQRLAEQGDQTQNLSLVDGDLVYVPRSIIGDVNLFVKRIAPIIQLWKTPGEFTEEADSFEKSNEALRVD